MKRQSAFTVDSRVPASYWNTVVAMTGALVCVLASSSLALANGKAGSRPLEPQAGTWQTYVLTSGAEISVPAPPRPASAETRAELRELLDLQSARTPENQAVIEFWNDHPAFKRWTEKQLELVSKRRPNPPRGSRGFALVHAAMYDAVIATWHWKYTFHRPRPSQLDNAITPSVDQPLHPSYPSEHAAIAGAVSRVLAHLFPLDAGELEVLAEEAAFSRLQAGTNYRSDVDAGLRLGRDVAAAVIERRALVDGSTAVWDRVGQPGRLTGPGFWEPTAPSHTFPPTEPLAGEWKTWVISSTGAFVSPHPPGFFAGPPATINVSELLGPALDLMESVRITNCGLTAAPCTAAEAEEGARRRSVISFWAGQPGERWNRITMDLLLRHDLNLPRAARVAALANTALADAVFTSWKSKYTYWTARPQTIIRHNFDPNFLSFRTTPSDPSYTSGLSTVSGALSAILAYFFPGESESLSNLAADAANSRFYDGSHWVHDNDAGIAAGRKLSLSFIQRALTDGAGPIRR